MRAPWLFFLLLTACQCRSPLQMTSLSPVGVSPSALAFEPTIVGTTRTLELTVSNPNRFALDVALITEGPFATTDAAVQLAGGTSQRIAVRFAPETVGLASGRVLINDIAVVLTGEGLVTPVCVAPTACEEASVDPQAMRCVVASRPEGAACSSQCVATGTCSGGECRGRAMRSCDDGDACTLDACDEARGCVSTLTPCTPPPEPCRIATCDRQLGCRAEEAPDGTLCGPDDCLASTVSVCVSGQCVSRTRPATALCRNTWVPAHRGGFSHLVAFDEDRRETLQLADLVYGPKTWTWNGAAWALRQPVATPANLQFAVMAWNPARRRITVVSVESTTTARPATWEWDGQTWVELHPPVSPTCLHLDSLAWERASRSLVLSCNLYQQDGGFEPQLWQWTGQTWRALPAAPTTAALRLVADPGRDELLGLTTDTTWRWTSRGFVAVGANPPRFWNQCEATDPVTRGLVRFGTEDDGGTTRHDWNGAAWVPAPASGWPGTRACQSAYDSVRGRTVFVHGLAAGWFSNETWEWDGHRFDLLGHDAPASVAAMFTTPTDVRLVSQFPSESWVWNGRRWVRGTDTPPTLFTAAAAWDERRGVGVVVNANPAETWLFDGGWSRVAADGLPPFFPLPRAVYSPLLGRVVVTGGAGGDDVLLSFDGTRWDAIAADAGFGARFFSALTTDSSGAVLSIGGRFVQDVPPRADVLLWDGARVSLLTPMPAPFVGDSTVFATFDPVRQMTVVIGEAATGSFDMAEWNGATWALRQPGVSPVRALAPKLAFEPTTRRVIAVQDGTTWIWLP